MLPPQERRPLRTRRRHPLRRWYRPFSGPPEPAGTASSRLGKPLRCAGSRTHRRASPTRAPGPPSAGRHPRGAFRLRRGHERGYYYHPSRHSAGQPIVAGWAYQFLTQLSFVRESWTAPMDVERVRPGQDANVVAAEQVRSFLRRRRSLCEGGSAASPLFVFDAGYDPVKVQQGLESSSCQILLRLRAGRRFYGDPSLCDPPENIGRPRRHGPKMKCNDPLSWPEPSAEHRCEGAAYGSVRVRAWAELHPKVDNHAGRGSRGPLPIVVGTLILVEVERLPRGERRREPRVLWLWWHGPKGTAPDLELVWRSYVRRFDLEHTFRFLKQSMGWTTPRVRHPEQADRWSWLVVAAYT